MGNKQANKILEVLDLDYSAFEPKHNVNFYPKDRLIDQQFYSDNIPLLPESWQLSRIRPEMVFHRRNFADKSVSYTKNEKLLVKELFESDFLTVSRIIFITHGFLCDRTTDWMSALKWELLNAEDCTVVTLCWKEGARLSTSTWPLLWYSYEQSAANALEVGKWLSKYILELRKGCKPLDIYCIGHSLGAHLIGRAGKLANKISGRPVIDRITGLDPSGPGFQSPSQSKNRMTKSDAKFVDVIHTDGWGYAHYFGSYLPMGSIDFYPINRSNQKNFGHSLRGSGVRPTTGITRNHWRAIDLFIWSISRKNSLKTNRVLLNRPSVECLSPETRKTYLYLQMGYHSDKLKDIVDTLYDTWYLVNVNWEIPSYN